MGQYYTPVAIDTQGYISTLYSHAFGSGLKLTEHSWVGNDFVNAVYALIHKNPKHIAWIGDYSDEEYTADSAVEPYMKAMPYENFKKYYKAAWGENEDIALEPKDFKKADFDIFTLGTTGMYLLNHDLQQYLDLTEYIEVGKTNDGEYDWCMNPLPLLTACGNDRGGGDFRSGQIGYDDVGLWAFDLLEYTDHIPPGYQKVTFCFKEEPAV